MRNKLISLFLFAFTPFVTGATAIAVYRTMAFLAGAEWSPSTAMGTGILFAVLGALAMAAGVGARHDTHRN